jgi:hypothetical protein
VVVSEDIPCSCGVDRSAVCDRPPTDHQVERRTGV